MNANISRTAVGLTIGLIVLVTIACSNGPNASAAPLARDGQPAAASNGGGGGAGGGGAGGAGGAGDASGSGASGGSYPQTAHQPMGIAVLGAPPMDPVREAMTVPSLHTEDQYLEPGSLYSLAVRDADVRDVLLALGRQSPFNFVISPYVKGTVTLDMHDVPLQNLMDAIVKPLDLSYRIDGDIIWVEPIDTSSEFFTLNYIITRRTSTRTVTGNSIASSSDFGSNASNSGVDTVSSTERTAIFDNIRKSIAMLMSPDGKLEINEETGLVSVIDYKTNLVRVKQFLQRVTEALNRQVMISAKLVEVTYNRGDQFGINWDAVFKDVAFSVAGRATDHILQGVLTTNNVDVVIRAIAQRENVVIKNSPNVSTLNNQAAIIVLGEQQVFFETVEDLDPVTGEVLRRRTSPRSVNVGVSLHVVPQIGSDGQITLNVHNRVTEKIGDAVGPDGTTVPELSVREVDTIAHMRAGQTMIIAGLTSERESKETDGVPILSDIPLLGNLVTTKRNQKRKTELVLFLTPEIVQP